MVFPVSADATWRPNSVCGFRDQVDVARQDTSGLPARSMEVAQMPGTSTEAAA